MCNTTREGNKIIPRISALRESIAWNSDTLCSTCKHVSDSCIGLDKVSNRLKGYNEITECEGFEPVST